MSALYDFNGYDNFVLAEFIESIMDTKLNMSNFLTADYQLSENPGMVKKIHKYKGTADVEDLARGDGLSGWCDAEYKEEEYRVARTQSGYQYYDDDLMTDPTLVEAKAKTLAEGMVNNWNKKAIDEFNKSENIVEITDYSLGSFADIIARYTNKYEDQSGLFFLVNVAEIPAIRRMLGDYLKYTEAYIRTGAVGDVLGCPIYTSKIVPSGIIFCATRDAVTAFVKKGVAVESDRDIDTKNNRVIAARYSVIALTDESKCIKAGKAQTTDLTAVADVSEATIAGAATTGAKVTAYDKDGEEIGHATAAGSTYSITYAEGTANEDIKVVAELEGFVPAILNIKSQA